MVCVSYCGFWVLDWSGEALHLVVLLIVVTQRQTVKSDLPAGASETWIDTWLFGCFLFSFIAFVESAVVTHARNAVSRHTDESLLGETEIEDTSPEAEAMGRAALSLERQAETQLALQQQSVAALEVLTSRLEEQQTQKAIEVLTSRLEEQAQKPHPHPNRNPNHYVRRRRAQSTSSGQEPRGHASRGVESRGYESGGAGPEGNGSRGHASGGAGPGGHESRDLAAHCKEEHALGPPPAVHVDITTSSFDSLSPPGSPPMSPPPSAKSSADEPAAVSGRQKTLHLAMRAKVQVYRALLWGDVAMRVVFPVAFIAYLIYMDGQRQRPYAAEALAR